MSVKGSFFKEFLLFIKEKSEVNEGVLPFLDYNEKENDNEGKQKLLFQTFLNITEKKQLLENKSEFQIFLRFLAHLMSEHEPSKYKKRRIVEILLFWKNELKNQFSKNEIMQIFIHNKSILLFLLENQLIDVNTILSYQDLEMNKFFYPEIREFDENRFKFMILKNEKFRKFVSCNDENLDQFYLSRNDRGNDLYFLKLIREDDATAFIEFVECNNINLNTQIKDNSLFDCEKVLSTNFLEISLIEYSALFGAIQIFKYLLLNEVEIKSKIWEYAIIGRNYEIIHFLEEQKIEIKENKACLKRAIRCHHNEIIEYLGETHDLMLDKSYLKEMIKSFNFEIMYSFLLDNLTSLTNDKETFSLMVIASIKIKLISFIKVLILQQSFDYTYKDKVILYDICIYIYINCIFYFYLNMFIRNFILILI